MSEYRTQVRETLGRMTDEALRFQDGIVRGGIDREEVDRELSRRRGIEVPGENGEPSFREYDL